MKYVRVLILMAAITLIGACSFTTPRDVGNHNILTLSGLEGSHYSTRKHGVLLVEFPQAAPELDTSRVSVLRADGRQDYFAATRWSDFLPVAVQSALIESIKNQSHFSYVEPEDGGTASRYILHTRINRFTATYSKGEPLPFIDVSMTFVVERNQGLIVNTFTLDRIVKAHQNNTAAVAAAFIEGLHSVAGELVEKLRKVI